MSKDMRLHSAQGLANDRPAATNERRTAEKRDGRSSSRTWAVSSMLARLNPLRRASKKAGASENSSAIPEPIPTASLLQGQTTGRPRASLQDLLELEARQGTALAGTTGALAEAEQTKSGNPSDPHAPQAMPLARGTGGPGRSLDVLAEDDEEEVDDDGGTEHGALSAASSPTRDISPHEDFGLAGGVHLHQVERHEEIPLAGYLLAREIDGRAVPEQELGRLRSAHETVVQTRKLLPWGRGNVRSDVEATGGESLVRAYLAQELAQDLAKDKAPGFEDAPNVAGAAMFARAGVCSNHAAVAMHLHAGKLDAPDEAVHFAGRPLVDHAWSELRKGRGRKNVIVMDAWAEGSAVYAEDARHTRLALGVKSYGRYDASNGPAAADRAFEAAAKLTELAPHETIDEIRHALKEEPPSDNKMLDARTVLDKRFTQRVEKKMAAPLTATQAQQIGRNRSGLGGTLKDSLSALGIAKPDPIGRPRGAELEREARQIATRRMQRASGAPRETDWPTAQREAKAQLRADYAKAEKRFAAAQASVRNDIKAIGVARSLGWAASVKDAVADAKEIVAAARDPERATRAQTLPKAGAPQQNEET